VRNVRRTMKIKNMNYLYWLLCLHRSKTFIEQLLKEESFYSEIITLADEFYSEIITLKDELERRLKIHCK